MAKVEFLGPINKDSLKLDIDNLNQLKDYFKDDAQLQEWLKICGVAVNDEIVSSLDIKIAKDDKISLLRPVCGG